MKLLIDTDPGHDDLIALILAGAVADIVAITVVSGNAPLSETTTNALVAADLIGFSGPVVAGADRPRVRAPEYATHVHGESGLDGAERPQPSREVDGTDAVEAMLDLADDETWVVPIGPLTNVAAALESDPSFASRVRGISIMGGAIAMGNVSPVAEFNIWTDPEAADIVFRSGARILMCGLDLTSQVRYDHEWIDSIRQPYVAALLRQYLANNRALERTGAPLHDPCAVLALTHPELFAFESRPVAVECAATLTRGMTVVDRRPRAAAPNAELAVRADGAAALDLVRDAINALGEE